MIKFFKGQYGFRKGHSTEYAALELVDRIITKMDEKHTPISIFLDLSKAFDSVWRNGMYYSSNYRTPCIFVIFQSKQKGQTAKNFSAHGQNVYITKRKEQNNPFSSET